MRKPAERLRDILEAAERIRRYASRGREAYEKDELIQSWIVRHIQIIGESVRLLPEEIRAKAPSVPWRGIIGMRHILVHEYFGIDIEAVWKVVEEDLPLLEAQVEALLAQVEDES